MEIQKTEGNTRKIMHDIRSHLSVMLASGEIAVMDEETISREDAVSVIKKNLAEVEEIMKLLEAL
jgi:hypothetical protein